MLHINLLQKRIYFLPVLPRLKIPYYDIDVVFKQIAEWFDNWGNSIHSPSRPQIKVNVILVGMSISKCPSKCWKTYYTFHQLWAMISLHYSWCLYPITCKLLALWSSGTSPLISVEAPIDYLEVGWRLNKTNSIWTGQCIVTTHVQYTQTDTTESSRDPHQWYH